MTEVTWAMSFLPLAFRIPLLLNGGIVGGGVGGLDLATRFLTVGLFLELFGLLVLLLPMV